MLVLQQATAQTPTNGFNQIYCQNTPAERSPKGVFFLFLLDVGAATGHCTNTNEQL